MQTQAEIAAQEGVDTAMREAAAMRGQLEDALGKLEAERVRIADAAQRNEAEAAGAKADTERMVRQAVKAVRERTESTSVRWQEVPHSLTLARSGSQQA